MAINQNIPSGITNIPDEIIVLTVMLMLCELKGHLYLVTSNIPQLGPQCRVTVVFLQAYVILHSNTISLKLLTDSRLHP